MSVEPRMFDHTILKAETTPAQVIQVCHEASLYRFGAVCVNSNYVPLCISELSRQANALGRPQGHMDYWHVKVCAVVGFPLGAMCSAAKVRICWSECRL